MQMTFRKLLQNEPLPMMIGKKCLCCAFPAYFSILKDMDSFLVYCMKSVEALFCDLTYLPVEVILFMIMHLPNQHGSIHSRDTLQVLNCMVTLQKGGLATRLFQGGGVSESAKIRVHTIDYSCSAHASCTLLFPKLCHTFYTVIRNQPVHVTSKMVALPPIIPKLYPTKQTGKGQILPCCIAKKFHSARYNLLEIPR